MKILTSILLILSTLTVSSCSSKAPLQLNNLSPRGISVANILQGQRAKGYRAAEKHCKKYFKVPRLLIAKSKLYDSSKRTSTMVFECIKPR